MPIINETMLRKIKKKIIEYLNSTEAPNFLYQLYFNQVKKKRKEKLFTALKEKKNLLELVSENENQHWMPRIKDVLSCPDNLEIPRDESAGKIIDGLLHLNNGIRIDPLSYYSFPMLKILMDNKGIHEPQEEKIFQEVIDNLPIDTEKTMIELGSYWSYYSIWFKKKFNRAKCFMVEPIKINLSYGIENFKLNKLKGVFIHKGIGSNSDEENNIISVDSICKENNIRFIDILHSDIQGFEMDMIKGCNNMLSKHRIGYLFISTHSNELHYNCMSVLKEKYGYALVASADLDESYSWDGILVMKCPTYEGPKSVSISKKKINKSANPI